MTHEELCERAYKIYIEHATQGAPACFAPLTWAELNQVVRLGYVQAAIAVQRSMSPSPKRDAYHAFASTARILHGVTHTWEQLPENLRKAWAAFTNFVIKEGRLN